MQNTGESDKDTQNAGEQDGDTQNPGESDQGGFPADPKYCAPLWYKENMPESEFPANPYFAGNGADEATKQATIEMICKTPLDYEPGAVDPEHIQALKDEVEAAMAR